MAQINLSYWPLCMNMQNSTLKSIIENKVFIKKSYVFEITEWQPSNKLSGFQAVSVLKLLIHISSIMAYICNGSFASFYVL